METIGDIGLLMIGFGIGMVCMGLAGFMVECWDRYQTYKLNKEWKL